MKWASHFTLIENVVVQDKNLLFTIVSYSVATVMILNLNILESPLVGLIASAVYFAINAIFLGNAFFEKENTFFRSMLGILLLTMLLGFVGWLTLIIYNLDDTRVAIVLLVVATFSSLLNRETHRNGFQ